MAPFQKERERDIGTWTVVICDGISEYPEKIYSNFQLYDILFKLAKLYTNIHDIQNLCQRMSSGIIPNRDGSSFYAWPRAPQHVWSLPFFSLQLHISNNIHVYIYIYIYRHITSSVYIYIYNVWTYTYIYIYLIWGYLPCYLSHRKAQCTEAGPSSWKISHSCGHGMK